MSKKAVYQKYRSNTFEEVVGQEYIVRSIKNAVKENRVGHAYLFCGPRGTGKTTMARLLAKAVNCTNKDDVPCGKCENCIAALNGTHPDIVEINGANETRVEDIRELIDRVQLAPMMGQYKVYIIDEVHQLSNSASSALLKTLEEPPKNVIFILATTDPQKMLPTIISRCQRYDFTKVKTEQISNHLLDIASKEDIFMDEEAAKMIALLADGGMRDALSIMDQCSSYTSGHITVEDINRIYGLTTIEEKIELIRAMYDNDIATVVNKVISYEQQGIDFQRFTDGMIDILKDFAIFDKTHSIQLMKKLNQNQIDLLKGLDANKCLDDAKKLLDDKQKFRFSTSSSTAFEIMCLSMMKGDNNEKVVTNTPVMKKEYVVPTKVINDKPIEHASKVTEEVIIEDDSDDSIMSETVSNNTYMHVEEKKYSSEEIVSILLTCDKQNKVKDENTFKLMGGLAEPEDIKYVSVLSNVSVKASGNDCILVSSGQDSIVSRINDENYNKELYYFFKNKMNTDKLIIAIRDKEYTNAVNLFISLRKSNNLPNKYVFNKYSEDNTKKETTVEDKIIGLFGEGNVDII